MWATAEIFGAPVTEPPGNIASRSSASETPSRSVPSTVLTRCVTPARGCSSMSSGQHTEPGSHTRARSLRSRSTIITCSAASFSEARKGGCEAGRIAAERGVQVLDEVDLVDVSVRDRGPHGLDRGCVRGLLPGTAPAADREAPAGGRRFGLGPDPASGEGEAAGLRRSRPELAPQSLREPVAEVEVGDESLRAAPPENGGGPGGPAPR